MRMTSGSGCAVIGGRTSGGRAALVGGRTAAIDRGRWWWWWSGTSRSWTAGWTRWSTISRWSALVGGRGRRTAGSRAGISDALVAFAGLITT